MTLVSSNPEAAEKAAPKRPKAIEKQRYTGDPRDARGRWTGGHRYGFQPGQSGNPGGIPKGYVKVNKRLANYLGTEEGWERVKAVLDQLLRRAGADGEDAMRDGDAIRLLTMILANDHQLDRNHRGEGVQAPPPPAIIIENASTHDPGCDIEMGHSDCE